MIGGRWGSDTGRRGGAWGLETDGLGAGFVVGALATLVGVLVVAALDVVADR
jgi:hypothetical protein